MNGESDQIEYLRNYLARPCFIFSGTDLKVFSRMGDRVADSISRILDPSEALDNTELKKVLAAVSASLEYPDDIANDAGRIPGATQRLLRTRLMLSKCPEQHARIQAAIEKMHLILSE